jgi:methionyl-tRNA formyltransferase
VTAGAAPGRAADPARTIFFGSGSFAVPILEALVLHPRIQLVGIVTAPDRAAGRGRTLLPTPIALKARTMWVPLLQPARVRAPEAIAEIAELAPDLGVLADYGQVVPEDLLALAPRGILNIHPSILPRHRGATPIPAAIAAGDVETGVSLIRMDAGVDTGPIIAARAWPLAGTERAPDLESLAAREGASLLAASLDGWLDGTLAAIPQPGDGATLTRQFRKADARLDPSSSAVELERRVRAQAPWPGTFVDTEEGRVAVLRASVASSEADDEPGTLLAHDGRLALATGDGRLVFEEAQREGRRSSEGRDFLRGQRGLVGTKVGAPKRQPRTTTAETPAEAPVS